MNATEGRTGATKPQWEAVVMCALMAIGFLVGAVTRLVGRDYLGATGSLLVTILAVIAAVICGGLPREPGARRTLVRSAWWLVAITVLINLASIVV